MPELPEVETIARDLHARIPGRKIRAIWTSGFPLRMAKPIDVEGLRKIADGRVVKAVRRTGKYLLIDLAGRADSTPGVLVHLGMSGRLQVDAAEVPRAPHTHVVFALDDGSELRFRDPRRFGWIAGADPIDASPELAGMGPDPLAALTHEELARRLEGARTPIKAFLLDQSRVAGLGNIYVCEALFRARIHPTTPAMRTVKRAPALFEAIVETLTLGIENRGTTLRDYVDSFGTGGNNAQALLVYGREGEPCRACEAPVRRRVDAGRSTFFCARCQKR